MKRFLLFLLLSAPLVGEILSVDLTWNKSYCDEGCNELIVKRYKQVPEVQDISIGPGYMTLQWKPNLPFTYLKVRRPMQRVGVHIEGIGVATRGTVHREGDKFFLTSVGDGTQFELTSPPPPKTTGGYTSYSNRKLYKLLPELALELTKAEKNKNIVKVSGYLLMPYRLPLTIIVGNFAIEPLPQEKGKPLPPRPTGQK